MAGTHAASATSAQDGQPGIDAFAARRCGRSATGFGHRSERWYLVGGPWRLSQPKRRLTSILSVSSLFSHPLTRH